jgi:hypothetical protein
LSDAAGDSLRDLVAASQQRIKALRQAGDLVALLAATQDVAEEIERHVGQRRDEEAREALIAVRRFTFNTAADCWPGWKIPEEPSETRDLLAARELARHSAMLTRQLELGALQEGTGIWLCGAFELALSRYDEAEKAFEVAREYYLAAEAPGLVLLTEGYAAILRQVAGRAGGESLEAIIAKIKAGGFKDGAEWVEQLETALKVFAR